MIIAQVAYAGLCANDATWALAISAITLNFWNSLQCTFAENALVASAKLLGADAQMNLIT